MAVYIPYQPAIEIKDIVRTFDLNLKHCKHCNQVLVVGINWTKAQEKVYSYMCSTCKNLASEKIRRSKGQKPRRRMDIEIVKTNRKKYNLKYWQDNPDKRAYHTYKNNAKKRDLVFNINFEEFMTFWQQPCSYCHDDVETIGIDRVDNAIGYELDNLISCCAKCNWMKADLSTEDFIKHCKKIIRGS